jgi:hypothetical protein
LPNALCGEVLFKQSAFASEEAISVRVCFLKSESRTPMLIEDSL